MINSPISNDHLKRKWEEEDHSSLKIQKLENTITVESLPNELLVRIFHFLPLIYWPRTACVNHRFSDCTALAYRTKIEFAERDFDELDAIAWRSNVNPEEYQKSKSTIYSFYAKKFVNLKTLDIEIDSDQNPSELNTRLQLIAQNTSTLRSIMITGEDPNTEFANPLSIANFPSQLIEQINQCKKIKKLKLTGCNFKSLKEINLNLPHLKRCGLKIVQGTSYLLSGLNQSSLKLEKLSLKMWNFIEEIGPPLEKIFQNCTRLNSFKYDEGYAYSDFSVLTHDLLPKLQQVKSLKNFSCKLAYQVPHTNLLPLFYESLKAFISSSKELESFSLDGWYHIQLNQLEIKHLIASCPKLKSLSLTYLERATDPNDEKLLIDSVCSSNIEKFETSQILSAESLQKLKDNSKVKHLSVIYDPQEKTTVDAVEKYLNLLESAADDYKMSGKTLVTESSQSLPGEFVD